MSEPAIETVELSKHYDEGLVRALDGVSLTVHRGENVAVTGPSGCGKSTLLHLLAALERPTSGTVRVGGEDLSTLHDRAEYRRRQVGLVFQLHNLLPHLSALQNVEIAMLGGERDRAARHARAMELLEAVDMHERAHRPPPKLSGGERQRVAIARALANDPPLILADEPTGALDAKAVDHVLALFARLREENPELTILTVTHDPRVADAAERVVAMRDGHIVGDEIPREVRRSPSGG